MNLAKKFGVQNINKYLLFEHSPPTLCYYFSSVKTDLFFVYLETGSSLRMFKKQIQTNSEQKIFKINVFLILFETILTCIWRTPNLYDF